MKSTELISNLSDQIDGFIAKAEYLKQKPIHELSKRHSETEWNILECFAHLNRYSEYYLPAIEKNMIRSNSKADPEFKSGLIGGYMAKMILPKEKLNKMKTFADMNPINSMLGMEEIETFIDFQKTMKNLMQKSLSVSLTKTMIPTTISKLIKMRLGDTFQFLANHTLRHFKQIENLENR